MKETFQILIFSIVLSILTGCRSDLDSLVDGHHRSKRETTKPVMKTIRMSFGGEFITESDEPLLRAEDGETYVGINVFWTEKDKEGAKEEKYAYGLFKKMDEINVDLLTGYTYRFEATILIERDDKIFDSGTGRVGAPFRYKDVPSDDNSYFEKTDIVKFVYTYDVDGDENRNYMIDLYSGMANVKTGPAIDDDNGDYHYPRLKRFYGSYSGFDPSLITGVEIPMEYKSFGLKFIVEKMPENTSLRISDDTDNGNKTPDDNKEFYLHFPENLSLNSDSETSKSWESIYSLYDFSKDTQEFRLKFIWNKGNGQKAKTFTHKVIVQAKKKKILKISIEGEVSQTKSGNITFTQMDDEDMELEEDPNPEEIKMTFTK